MSDPEHSAPRRAANALTTGLESHLARLDPAWRDLLLGSRAATPLRLLTRYIDGRLESGAEIYPHDPFRALNLLAPDAVQVVILGQDPYHGADQAQGLAFSVPDTTRTPPSLRNIFKELRREYPAEATRAGHQGNDLTRWAKQGVLLLNAVLTVEAGRAGSHARRGWEVVTDVIIEGLAQAPQPKVFLLWGAYAQAKRSLIESPDAGPSLVLASNHPSPLSAERPPVPFVGNGHFEKANAYLREKDRPGVDWLASPN